MKNTFDRTEYDRHVSYIYVRKEHKNKLRIPTKLYLVIFVDRVSFILYTHRIQFIIDLNTL